MTTTPEFHADIAKWRQIADVIRTRIENGDYPPRTAIPAAPELAETFEVSLGTVTKAVASLKTEGIVYTTPGLGTFAA